MDRFLVSLFPLLRRFAGFLVRSFFRASFPYFFRLKKGLVSRVGTKQPCFQKLEEIGAEDRGGEKRKIRRRFIVVVAWGIAIWSSLSIIDAVAPPAPLLLWRRRRRRVVVGNGDLYFCGQSQPTGAEEGKTIAHLLWLQPRFRLLSCFYISRSRNTRCEKNGIDIDSK